MRPNTNMRAVGSPSTPARTSGPSVVRRLPRQGFCYAVLAGYQLRGGLVGCLETEKPFKKSNGTKSEGVLPGTSIETS